MSLPKIMPLPETVALIELQSLLLEEKPVTLTPVPPRPALPNRIAVIGNYLPRHCGIATFTTDLCDAIHAEYGATELLALPVNDTEEGYDYPAWVRFELSQDNLASYNPSFIIWASGGKFLATPWHTPTSIATGESTPILHRP
ncbi:MAG TPA: hypothetical protein VK937_23115 [Candidatus Limnocylindria bacterium]|nr:hypothetical protein [Candidatus Limnocylindria bacterium]